MGDLISRKALYKKITDGEYTTGNTFKDMELQDFINEQPTVDAAPVVHGEWIKHKPNPEVMRLFHQDGIAEAMGENSIYWTCSECGNWGTPAHKYCPECGAKMDGKKGEEEC